MIIGAGSAHRGIPCLPKVGFVSLGCPKALVDSERILTQLRTEGYEVTPEYNDADVVVVNTCGFIDSAKAESLEAIGEALAENGKVIVTGCMGVEESVIRNVHPSVLAVTGPQQYEEVVRAVHNAAPPKKDHNPYLDLVPPQGIKLTPRHYAYLKISEGCNHRCSFCIIPSMRGDLVSRPVGDVLSEAERLVKAGVKELLVISQDTSAYGVDMKFRSGFWNGRPVKTRMTELCTALSEMGVWTRLHYVYPYPHVDEIIPLMAEGKVLPYLDIPFQHASPRILKAMKRPAFEDKTLAREALARAMPGPDHPLDLHRRLPRRDRGRLPVPAGLDAGSPARPRRLFPVFAGGRRAGEPAGQPVPDEVKQERWERFMEQQQAISASRLQAKVGREIDVLIDEVDEDGAVGPQRRRARDRRLRLRQLGRTAQARRPGAHARHRRR